MRRERTRTYVGRVYLGHGKYQWVGRFPTKKARDNAVAAERTKLRQGKVPSEVTCREWAARFLARREREHKASTHTNVRQALGLFLTDFGDHRLASVTRLEALDWAERVAPWRLPTSSRSSTPRWTSN